MTPATQPAFMPASANRRRRCAAALAAGLLAAAPFAVQTQAQAQADAPLGPDTAFKDQRAIWMSRFEFNSQQSIRDRVAAVADAGFTDLYFQVRGQGDVHFPSQIESWDPYRYPTGFGQNGPNYDPLQTALDEANKHGLKVHAWLNTIPMWRDTTFPHNPPSDPNHFYNTHPELRLKDANGNDMPLSSGQYVGVNPTHPGTVDHLTALANELATNYDDLAGIHLDYIRMVTGSAFSPLTYPQDPDTVARYFAETNRFPASDPDAYKQWVGDKITVLVEAIRDTIKATDPNLQLSAAVWRDFNIGGRDYQQFADDWVQNASLDVAFPMIYTRDDALYRDNLLKWKALDENAGVAVGLGSYLHDSSTQTLDQLNTAQFLGANGFNIFSYGTLFSGSSLNAFGQAVKAFNEELAARPDDNLPLTDFDDGTEGFFGFSPLTSGSNLNLGSGTTADLITTDAYQFQPGDAAQQIVIDADNDADAWFLRHLAGGEAANPGTRVTPGSPSSNQELLAEGFLGFWLKTSDQGLTVTVAVDDVEGTAERGTLKDVIADGQWHLYQWNLADDAQWDGWVNGNGQINGQTVTLDSIQFFGEAGTGDATVLLDAIAFNPFGPLGDALVPTGLAGDFNNNGVVEQADLDLVLGNWGATTTPDSFAANTQGLSPGVDQDELDAVLGNWGASLTPSDTPAIPEPAWAGLALATLAWCGRRVA